MARVTEVAAADKAKIIDIVCIEIDRARDLITSEASWERLERFFFEKLALCDAIRSEQITAWAVAGHPAADRAARLFAFEMRERGLEDALLMQVKAYANRVLARPFLPFPRGRHVVQNLMRDAWLPLVVQNVADGTGLHPTRSSTTTTPSAAYFVTRGMKKKGFKLSEREVNRIFWRRNELAARLEASMPQIPSTIK